MKLSSSLTFNIIFVPGTVRYLRLAVVSLLHNSNCSYRLVSNGCREEEARLLQDWCRENSRLQFFEASRTDVIPHGQLLTRLQRDEQSPLFAFMDSDIFASDNFLDELGPKMDSADAVFACPPIFWPDELQTLTHDKRTLSGKSNRYSDGTCVGGTYFAIYDNAILSEMIRESGLTFRKYFSGKLPPAVQNELRQVNRIVNIYDTGKALNLLMALRGFRCQITKLDSLCHIGGVSATAMLPRYSLRKLAVSRMIPVQILKLFRWMKIYNGNLDEMNRSERKLVKQLGMQRQLVSSYLSSYLSQLELGTRKPGEFRHRDAQLVARVRETEQLLERLKNRYSECGVGSQLSGSAPGRPEQHELPICRE